LTPTARSETFAFEPATSPDGPMTDVRNLLTSPVLTVEPGSPVAATCSISVQDVEGDIVSVDYFGLSGNQPHTWANYVGIWAGSIIAFGTEPVAKTVIPFDLETGSVNVETTITDASYTAGYVLGAQPDLLCASQLIGAGGQPQPANVVGLSINNLGTTSISVAYATPPGYLPAQAGNWVGLWQGEIDPYDPGPFVATTKITSDANVGDASIVAELEIKTTYTLVYLLGAADTTAAATVTFTTSS
jgi:hypothetical protein